MPLSVKLHSKDSHRTSIIKANRRKIVGNLKKRALILWDFLPCCILITNLFLLFDQISKVFPAFVLKILWMKPKERFKSWERNDCSWSKNGDIKKVGCIWINMNDKDQIKKIYRTKRMKSTKVTLKNMIQGSIIQYIPNQWRRGIKKSLLSYSLESIF